MYQCELPIHIELHWYFVTIGLVHGLVLKVNSISALTLSKFLAAATNQSIINLDFCAFLQKKNPLTQNLKARGGHSYYTRFQWCQVLLLHSFLLMVVYSVLSLLFFRSGKTDYQEVSVWYQLPW